MALVNGCLREECAHRIETLNLKHSDDFLEINLDFYQNQKKVIGIISTSSVRSYSYQAKIHLVSYQTDFALEREIIYLLVLIYLPLLSIYLCQQAHGSYDILTYLR